MDEDTETQAWHYAEQLKQEKDLWLAADPDYLKWLDSLNGERALEEEKCNGTDGK